MCTATITTFKDHVSASYGHLTQAITDHKKEIVIALKVTAVALVFIGFFAATAASGGAALAGLAAGIAAWKIGVLFGAGFILAAGSIASIIVAQAYSMFSYIEGKNLIYTAQYVGTMVLFALYALMFLFEITTQIRMMQLVWGNS